MATNKQKKAMYIRNKEMIAGNNPPMGKILKEAGYSDSLSRTPKVVTESKGWNELMAKYDGAEEQIMDAVVEDSLGKDKRVAVQNRNIFLKTRGRFSETINVNEYKKNLSSLIPDEEEDFEGDKD